MHGSPADAARRGRARRPSRARARSRGFTLLEMMLVVLLAAMMMTGASVGFGAMRRARVRTGAANIASAFRAAYVHALTTGRSTRVAFALGDGRVWIEDTEDAHALDAHDPLRAGGALVTDPEQLEAAARREAEAISNLRPRAPRAEFQAIPGRRFRPRTLEGVTFARLYTSHTEEPRESGTGYVYFFSGGQAERAVVHLRGEDGTTYSVLLHPLSGRAQVFDHPVEPPRIEEPSDERTERDARDEAPQEAR